MGSTIATAIVRLGGLCTGAPSSMSAHSAKANSCSTDAVTSFLARWRSTRRFARADALANSSERYSRLSGEEVQNLAAIARRGSSLHPSAPRAASTALRYPPSSSPGLSRLPSPTSPTIAPPTVHTRPVNSRCRAPLLAAVGQRDPFLGRVRVVTRISKVKGILVVPCRNTVPSSIVTGFRQQFERCCAASCDRAPIRR